MFQCLKQVAFFMICFCAPLHPQDNVSDLTAKFALTSVGSIDQGSDPYAAGIPGQAIPIVPTVVPHIQSVYSSAHPAQFTQVSFYHCFF